MIYVECRPDAALLTCLKISRKQFVHESNKFEVCKRIQRQNNCIGLIDEDPGSAQPRYVERLTLAKDLPEQNLKMFHDRRNNNYLIVVRPRLEEWVIEASRKAGINLKDYGLPNSGREFHQVINLRLDSFQRLLAGLNDAGALNVLRKLLMVGRKGRPRRTEK